MGILQPRLALAFVACAALFLTGCPEPQGKESKDPVVKKEAKPSEQPTPDPVAKKVDDRPASKKPAPLKPTETKSSEKDAPTNFPLDKWGVTAVEQAWGLKFKSVSYQYSAYTFLVEFTRTLTPEELQSLKEAFPQDNEQLRSPPKVVVYYFDKDSVVVNTAPQTNEEPRAKVW